jgi:hypothetical protein
VALQQEADARAGANLEAAGLTAQGELGCPFKSQQFDPGPFTPARSPFSPALKTAIIKADAGVGKAHHATLAQAKAMAEEVYQPGVMKMYGANHHGEECLQRLKDAQAQLISFLRGELKGTGEAVPHSYHWPQVNTHSRAGGRGASARPFR